jgi:AcrR family transcriptional regulator
MAATRLDGDERRKAIVAAAVPLFARKGFAGTTTKELAEAAGISEAPLFRHFAARSTTVMIRACAGGSRRRPGARCSYGSDSPDRFA